MFGKYKSIVGLDIGSSSVKVVELTKSGQKLIVSGFGTAEIESPDTIGETIQQVLRDTGIKTRRCVTAVSGRSVIIRQVGMMNAATRDLRQAIEYEADKYIPFDVSEVQLDAQPLPLGSVRENEDQTKVLLVAVKKSLIEEHTRILESAGLKPVIIDVDVFALGNAFELRNLCLGTQDDQVRALVDIGASKTNINIMRGNQSYFQREIYVAGNDLTDAIAKRFGEDPKDVEKMKRDPGGALESIQDAMVPVLEDIGSEIRLSFDYFENQFDARVQEVYLSGGTAYFPGVDSMLTQIFQLPTRVWDPAEGLVASGGYSQSVSSSTNCDMAIAMGLASRLIGISGLTPTRATTVTMPDKTASMPVEGSVRLSGVDSTGPTLKAVFLGTLLAAVVGAGVLFFNAKAYREWYVLAEGLGLGMAAGIGIWQGLKALKPAPGMLPVFVSCLLVTALVCGGLLGGRFMLGMPIRPEPPKVVVMNAPPPPDRIHELEAMKVDEVSTAALNRRINTLTTTSGKDRKQGLNVDDIAVSLRILGHWILTIFVCILYVSRKSRKAEMAM